MSHRNDQQHRQQGNGAQHRNQMGGEYYGPRNQQSAYQGSTGQYGGNYGADTNYNGPQQHGAYETQGNIRGNEDSFNRSFGTEGGRDYPDHRDQDYTYGTRGNYSGGGDVLTPYERNTFRGRYSQARPDYGAQAGGLQDYYNRGFNRGRQPDQFAQGYGTRPYGDYDPDYGVRGGYPGYRDDNGQGSYGQQQAARPHYDPDYHQWRNEQLRGLDDDYHAWRSERYNNFTQEFDAWRKNRKVGTAVSGSNEANKASGTDNGSSTKSK